MVCAESEQKRITGAIIGAIACISIFSLTIGLTYPLLAFRLDAQGHGETAIGINAAMTPLGILCASPFIPRILERFRAWRVAALCLLAAGALIVAMAFTRDYVAYLGLRFLLGVVDAGVFIISETWINQLVSQKSRGRVVGAYATALSAGFGSGPLILSLVGVEGEAPFFIGAGLCAVAIAVVLGIRAATPSVAHEAPGSLWAFARLAPLLLIAVGVFAFWDGAILALFPVFGADFGLEASFVALALGVCILGNTFLQIPIGWAADRVSRRAVMMVCAGLAALGAAALPAVIETPALLLTMLFFWGAAAGGIYTMSMAELGDRFQGPDLVAGNAAFAIAFGLGGVVAGPATGAAMGLFGPTGFSWSLAAVFLVICGLAFRRR